MSELWVKIDNRCTTREYQGNKCGDWGEWTESWSNNLAGVYLSNEHGEERVTIDYDVKLGDDVYVLWAEYNSGDSFGYGHRNSVDVVHVFKDAAAAFAARDALLHEPAGRYKDSNATYKTDSGTEIKYYRPWCGFFESLDTLHVDKSWVQP